MRDLAAQFFHLLFHLRLHLKAMVFTTTLFLLLLPGQNYYQTLELHPQPPQVRATTVTAPELADYPVFSGTPAPALSAPAAIVVDVDSAVIMYEKNPRTKLMPASTTKIMTALVALEQYNLTEILTVQEADESIGHSMHLKRGEKISAENLLYGILVESGNDAALTLAQNYPGGYQKFVDRMNQKTRELNAEDTTFRNVSGVEQYNHVTSVRDLALIGKAAMQNPIFARMVATKSITVTSADGAIVHELSNINELLGEVPGLRGIKTGWTEHAGECLVTLTERNGRSIITVILGSNDRFGESTALIEWAFANHTWEKVEL